MLHELTYTTRKVNGHGRQQALIHSPHSAHDFIWAVDTTHAAGGSRKHAQLIHDLARNFIEQAAEANLTDNFARHFDDGHPAIFNWFDGGEDPSDEPTKIVCIDPRAWSLMGPIAHPWTVAYDGLVFHLDAPVPTLVPYTPFWTAAWMEQITINQLSDAHPGIAEMLEDLMPGREFATGPQDQPSPC